MAIKSKSAGKSSAKKAPTKPDKAQYVSIGQNVDAKRVDDVLYLRIDLSQEGTLSQTGRANIIARTEGQRGFADLSEVAGEDFGLNLICSRRVVKGGAKRKPARRDDDDEGDD